MLAWLILADPGPAFPGSAVGAMHFGCNTTGPENAAQLSFLARFQAPIFEFRQQSEPRSRWRGEEAVLEAQAAALRSSHPSAARAYVYRSAKLGSVFEWQRTAMQTLPDAW